MPVSRYLAAKAKFDQVEIVEFITFPLLAAAPPVEAGRMYVNTTDDKLRTCEDGISYSTVSAT